MLIGGVEYQVVIPADDSGHLAQTGPTYTFFIKNQALSTVAAKVHWDIFNATGSGKVLELRGAWISPALNNAAITGAVAVDFDLFRTSAVGTGGTTLTSNGAAFPTIALVDTTNAAIPAQVTVRAAPTGGATSSHAICSNYITQEESNAGAQVAQWNNILPVTHVGQRYVAREGQGFKLTQISFASPVVAQNFSFYVLFTLV